MKQKGFSLVELIIVVAIFLIITMVVVFNQNRFSSDISNSNIAYLVALKIREAQVFGTLVRQESEVTDDFSLGYGISFTDTDNFVVFADSESDSATLELNNGVAGDGVYDHGDDDVLVSSVSLTEGNTISDICLWVGETKRCRSTDDFEQVDIVFRRPEPNAHISAEGVTEASRAEIIIASSLRDKFKLITVRSTGQISVTNFDPSE